MADGERKTVLNRRGAESAEEDSRGFARIKGNVQNMQFIGKVE
jgi:hypothetical protein